MGRVPWHIPFDIVAVEAESELVVTQKAERYDEQDGHA